MKNIELLAGAAKIKTTPPLGTRINGDFITHYAIDIHDDLYARALILQQGDVRLAIIVVDICVMPKEFLDDVKSRITRHTNIPYTHIMISATHTHAAGSVADVHLGSADPAYTVKLPELILKSVLVAITKLKPATVGFGKIIAPEHLLCRRYFMDDAYQPMNPVTGMVDEIKTNPAGCEDLIRHSQNVVDPELNYLAVKGQDNRWISLIANYSLHYVGDWPNGTISADYFGVFSNQITALLEADDTFVGMMSNGTSGDVNIWDFQNTGRYPSAYFDKSALIGTDLANRVFESFANIQWQTNPQLSALYEEVTLPVRKPTKEVLLAAAETMKHAEYENIVVDQDGLTQIYAREQHLLNNFPNEKDCPVQAFRIGSGVIGALAGEFFSETGLHLKAEITSSIYFTVTMANGNVGYVPPFHEMKMGGYETWRCRYSCMDDTAEHRVRNKLIELVESI